MAVSIEQLPLPRGTRRHSHAATLGFLSRCMVLGLVASLFLASTATALPRYNSIQGLTTRPWGGSRHYLLPARIIDLRGGSSVEEEEDEDEYDDEEYDSEEEEDEEEEDDEEEDEAEQEDSADDVQIEVKVEKFYDEPLSPSPMTNLYASLGVMLLGRRVDLFNKNVVRIARIAYIAYLILHQLFLLYVRFQAKSINDRTPIELKNPLTSVLESQLSGGEGDSGGVMKNLASSFLSSKSTVMEYDLKQARSMQSGLIFSMCFMWFLHFKMGQVQPLLIQAITGMSALIYSPLFQIYGLGRNLERPFKHPAMSRAEEAAKEAAAAGEKSEEAETTEEASAEAEDKEIEESDEGEAEVEAEPEGDTADEEEEDDEEAEDAGEEEVAEEEDEEVDDEEADDDEEEDDEAEDTGDDEAEEDEEQDKDGEVEES